jgi:hypothetical protein
MRWEREDSSLGYVSCVSFRGMNSTAFANQWRVIFDLSTWQGGMEAIVRSQLKIMNI